MYLIGASLLAPAAAPSLAQNSAIVGDMVWLLAASGDGLEHVRVHTGDRDVVMVLFIRCSGVDAAERAARRLCDRLVDRVPFLAGWRVEGCWSLDPPGSRSDVRSPGR